MNPPKDYIMMAQPEATFPVCPICMSSDSPPVTFSCSHSCCQFCWTQIISAANSNFMVKDILCFQLRCKQPIQNIDQLVGQIPDKDIVSRFQYLKKKQEIINNKDKFICPNVSCGKVIDSNDQEQARREFQTKLASTEQPEAGQEQTIENLDYSFLVCDDCHLVFCKICEIYHKPGEATCLRRARTSSTNILKVADPRL